MIIRFVLKNNPIDDTSNVNITLYLILHSCPALRFKLLLTAIITMNIPIRQVHAAEMNAAIEMEGKISNKRLAKNPNKGEKAVKAHLSKCLPDNSAPPISAVYPPPEDKGH